MQVLNLIAYVICCYVTFLLYPYVILYLYSLHLDLGSRIFSCLVVWQVLLSGKHRLPLRQRLKDMWEKINFLYVHEDQEPIPSTTSSQQLCVQFGMCVCSGIGLQALSFHKRLTSFLRPFFTPKRRRSKKDPVTGKRIEIELTGAEKQKQVALKAQKQLMDDGFVVIKIEQANNLHADSHFEGFESLMGSSWAKLAADCLQDDGVGCAPSSSAHASNKACWFHCGHVNYNNWFLCLMPLKPVGEPNQAGLQRLEVFDRVKPQMSVHTFAEHFDFDVAWNLKMYTIESATSELSLDEMYPNWVLVREYTSFSACQAWRGWAEEERFRKEEQKRARGKAEGGKKRTNAERTEGSHGLNINRSKKRRVASQPVSESLQGDQNAVEDDVNLEFPVPPVELNDPTDDMNMDIHLFDDGADSESHASEDSLLSALRGSNGRPESEASALGEDGEEITFDLDLEPAQGQTHLGTEHPDRPEPASSSRVVADTVEPPVPAGSIKKATATATVTRKAGESTIILRVEDFGELRLNEAQNHIMAVCNNPRHLDSECRKVRTLKPPGCRALWSNPGQGRPLGLLTSWLVAGYRWDTAEQHKSALAEAELTFDRRKKGRVELKKIAGFDQWKGRLAERPKTDGEESEPEIIK